MEQYQTEWVRGSPRSAGVRECEHRYAVIREFCSQYTRPFTVLDIGANLGYFSLRLAEDFDCTVVAVEDLYADQLAGVLEANGNPRVVMLQRHVTIADLHALAEVEHFDVTLAMSVVHHIGPYEETLAALRCLGDHLLLELPVERNACNQHLVAGVRPPANGVLLGWGDSHLTDARRPIYHVSTPKSGLIRSYLDTPETDSDVQITSDFGRKTFEYRVRGECRDWWRGINLRTFQLWGGRYPSRATVAGLVRDGWDGEPHGDVRPWNVVLQGDAVKFIDRRDARRFFTDDDANLSKLVEAVATSGDESHCQWEGAA